MTQRDTGPWDAIVLAAGRGQRFGGGKLTAPLDDKPLVAGALSTAFRAPVRRVFVAVGPDPTLRETVRAIAARLAETERLVMVSVEDSTAGMGVSLADAARAASDDARGIFVFLGDMPRIDPRTPERLAVALRGPDDIVAPTYLGRRGHPVLFGADWLPALRALSGDEGARTLIARAGARLIQVAVDDPGIHLDVDRPEDLRALQRP
jgi:molybdenum cofactor cytidylyltransferase